MLTMEGVEAERLAAIGYGQYQPVARNDTEEGRRRNRRVVLLISRDASIRGAVR
jgi:chemotaxis protein MotB